MDYVKIKMHLDRHVYTRGQFKGDAPADPRRRSRTHDRIVRYQNKVALRFHYTDVVTVATDGSFTINCNGYSSSPTTRKAVWEFAQRFSAFTVNIRSVTKGGLRNTAIAVADKTYPYYDGIAFDAQGQLTSELKPWTGRRLNKAEVAEIKQDMEQFLAVFPLLYAAAQTDDTRHHTPYHVTDALDPDRAERWPSLMYRYSSNRGYPRTKQQTLNAIRKDIYKFQRAYETYEIPANI